jgi:hypothetical protein
MPNKLRSKGRVFRHPTVCFGNVCRIFLRYKPDSDLRLRHSRSVKLQTGDTVVPVFSLFIHRQNMPPSCISPMAPHL